MYTGTGQGVLLRFRDHDKLWGILIDNAAREVPISIYHTSLLFHPLISNHTFYILLVIKCCLSEGKVRREVCCVIRFCIPSGLKVP